jgi:putative oxidoreductase
MKNKVMFGVCLLTGLMFINSGLNKVFKYIPVPENLPEDLVNANAAFMEIGWLMPMVAIVEIIGGILFVTPRYRALGAIMLLPVVLGILFTHIFFALSGLPIAIIFLGIVIWVIIENRNKYTPMLKAE